nr:MCE family protein [Thermoleophilaceae bacterium]
MRKRGRFSAFQVGLAAMLLIAIASFFAFTKDIPFTRGTEIKAVFKDTSALGVNSPVRIAGVEVGKVSKVEAAAEDSSASMVTMQIKDDGLPLHTDARVKIRPRIFLEGNFYVELRPGSPSAPELGDGDMIPIQQTAIPVQLDQVLKALEKDTRVDLREALAELFRAYSDDAGKSFNSSLQFQPDAYRFSSRVNEALLGKNPHDLSDYIRDQGTVAAALDRNPGQLKALI